METPERRVNGIHVDLPFTLRVFLPQLLAHKGDSIMAGWAERKLDELADKETKEREERQQYLAHRDQVKAEAPERWTELVKVLDQEVARFSEKRPNILRLTDIPDSKDDTVGKMLQHGDQSLHIIYKKAIPEISFTLFQSAGPSRESRALSSGKFSFRAVQECVWLVNEGDGQKCNVAKAAEYFLNVIFG
jgi:hypothetical protein